MNITISRTGYTFGGWFLDTQYTGPEITSGDYFTLDQGHTLYAKWNPRECKVNFMIQGDKPNNYKTLDSITGYYDSGCNITIEDQINNP